MLSNSNTVPSSYLNVILAWFEGGIAAQTTNETSRVQCGLWHATQCEVQIGHCKRINDLVIDPEVRHGHSVLSQCACFVAANGGC